MEWRKMGISDISITVIFTGNGSYSSFNKKEISKKFCPKCGIEIIIWYRICPNCGYIFKPGCKKEDLTEMIEDALDQEEIEEFDQLENSADRMEEIEECMIERYIHNEKNM